MIEGVGRFRGSEMIVKIQIEDRRERSEGAVVEDRGPPGYNNEKDQDQICGQSRDAPRNREQLENQGEEKIDCSHTCAASKAARGRNEPESLDSRTGDGAERVRSIGAAHSCGMIRVGFPVTRKKNHGSGENEPQK